MKTLKTMLAGIALLLVCATVNANINVKADKPTKNEVINTYADAMAHSNVATLDKVLDSDMQFITQRGENVSTLSKDQLIASIKSAPATTALSTTVTVVEDTDDSFVANVVYKYDGFTRTDLVTITNGSGWSVSKVECSYKY